ncbi:3-isopropylmalate dehydratase small subunit [Novosphingobium taihuense]|uniref:3-isopropylmalate dehydratase small subunit n=1 Tax=Novosphingobium taihuense TaxID=260085 RepID=A0A7W7ADB3_9SPHN|nr:3-isopropylmalate dehydratase small subunit [Novosphingobium taihuense]MBB4614786.1 3-isopropylmalate/(R)-2-methylmalate dehydratase small subunit [Novosphingobium taihuense]TWH84772.1 3-isopropylmalate/(R)-2-methylmalate dehydratase small subunit [Novosphingobium taihuense]
MTPFITLASRAIPLLRDNIDTDAVIPSREMKTTGRTGLADGLFAPWRYGDAAARTPDPTFALNQSQAVGQRILLAGENFGCGSSREHAVWALMEWGIACVIAPSFAPIFKANALRNGLLPVALSGELIAPLAWEEITVDLPSQTVTCGDAIHRFEIETEPKEMLIEGLDAIDLTLKSRPEIDAWTEADKALRPWIYLEKHA